MRVRTFGERGGVGDGEAARATIQMDDSSAQFEIVETVNHGIIIRAIGSFNDAITIYPNAVNAVEIRVK